MIAKGTEEIRSEEVEETQETKSDFSIMWEYDYAVGREKDAREAMEKAEEELKEAALLAGKCIGPNRRVLRGDSVGIYRVIVTNEDSVIVSDEEIERL
jgi:hypothetical protein